MMAALGTRGWFHSLLSFRVRYGQESRVVQERRVRFRNICGSYSSVRTEKDTAGEIDRSEFNVCVVETAGRSLKSSLQRSDPFRGSRCLRQDCVVCETGVKGRCDRNSVVYTITCIDCGDVYHGETSRSAYVRCLEHERSLRRKSGDSCLWNHCVSKHESEERGFQYAVAKTFRNDAMLRQISESVAINRIPPYRTLNDKSEWNQQRVPRAAIIDYWSLVFKDFYRL